MRALGQGPARPFDAARSGLSVAEGAGALALEAGEGPALAYHLGGAGRNDANHITGPARDGRGLYGAITEALHRAQIAPEEVALVSAHGTGTRYNDAMEGQALPRALPHGPPVSAIKGAVGHTLGAAGILEAIVCVRALDEGRCPPAPGLEAPDPEIALDVIHGAPRAISAQIALSTSSGFSGINSATLIGRAPRPRVAEAPRAVYLTRRRALDLDREALEGQIAHLIPRPERLDDLCVAGLAAAAALDPPRDAAIYMASRLGCLGGDVAFYEQLRARGLARVNPRLFAYTLPNVVLGEIAVALGMRGDNALFSAGGASLLATIHEAAEAIRVGQESAVMVLALDVPPEGPSTIAALLLEGAEGALERGALMEIGAGRLSFAPGAPGGADPMALAPLFEAPKPVALRCPSGFGVDLALRAPGPIYHQRRARFPAAWPAFAGHFPDRPIVPGAELLAAAAELEGRAIREVTRLTFRAPILPDEIIAFERVDEALTVRVGEEIRARGQIQWRDP